LIGIEVIVIEVERFNFVGFVSYEGNLADSFGGFMGFILKLQ
jgi:hypothetical protein